MSVYRYAWLIPWVCLAAGCVDLPRFELERAQSEDRWKMTRADVKARLAAAELDAGNLDRAATEVFRARQLDPENAQLRLLEARVLLNRGESARAGELLEPLASDPQIGAQALYLLGLSAQQQSEWTAAADLFAAAWDREPRDLAAYTALVATRLQLGQTGLAAELVRHGASLFSASLEYHAAAAEVAERNSDWPAAANAWRRVADGSGDEHSRGRLAEAAFRAGRWAEALAALDAGPSEVSAETEYRRSMCQRRLGADEAALRSAVASLRLEPDHLAARKLLLEMLLERGDVQEARKLAIDAVRRIGLRDPELAEAALALEARFGDKKQAKHLAEQMLRGDRIESRLLAEQVLRRLGD